MSEAVIDNKRAAGEPLAFLKEALAGLRRREALLPALLLLIVLTVSNIVILQNLPPALGAPPPLPFVIAAFVRIAGVLIFAVALLRVAGGSERPKWRPDGAFWLYGLVMVAGFAVSYLARTIVGGRADLVGLLLGGVVSALILSPFAAWVGAIAAARPLAWKPVPWVGSFRLWLAPLLFWWLLLVVPMATLHAMIGIRLLKGGGDLFWPLALFDGALSTLMALIGFGLNAAAYRRVARG